ncbi:aldolase/citrate lyase family protein, partial [Salmonella enterica subsp. enterica serovar Cerro]|nr:aldolase/citrate lyase family protein [Salmonella enterica subsp. enterica serovar Cerro]
MKRRDTIVRYTAPERINHWIVAFCFVLAAVSGLGFLFPSFNWLMHIMGTPQLARILHPFVGVAFVYGADAVMFDLEDAVALREKDTARLLVHHALQHPFY